MARATTAASGDRSPGLDHRRGLLHLLAAGPDRDPLSRPRLAQGRGSPPTRAREAVQVRPRARRRFVAGADEAGRGSLAGPLVAAAVLLDYERLTLRDRRALGDLDDSKQRTPEEREALYPLVVRAAARVAVTVRCVRGIDARGLHVTNLAALARSLERVAVPGRRLPRRRLRACRSCSVEHRAVVDGDARSAAIAAASVIAKVTRDRYMHRVADAYPELRVRRQRRLLDPRAPRGDRRARPLGASPPLVRVDRLLAARAAA